MDSRSLTAHTHQSQANDERGWDWPDNIVTWNGKDDPECPMNWPLKKKIPITLLLGLTTMGSAFASSSFSPTFIAVAEEFHVSTEVTTLTLSLYVLGFAFGPLVRVLLILLTKFFGQEHKLIDERSSGLQYPSSTDARSPSSPPTSSLASS